MICGLLELQDYCVRIVCIDEHTLSTPCLSLWCLRLQTDSTFNTGKWYKRSIVVFCLWLLLSVCLHFNNYSMISLEQLQRITWLYLSGKIRQLILHMNCCPPNSVNDALEGKDDRIRTTLAVALTNVCYYNIRCFPCYSPFLTLNMERSRSSLPCTSLCSSLLLSSHAGSRVNCDIYVYIGIVVLPVVDLLTY